VPFEAANGAFSMELPVEWHDFTAEYVEAVPDTILAAYWSTGSEPGELLTPFATVSTRHVLADLDVAAEVDEDIASWVNRMTRPVESAGAEFETENGGRGAWGTVTGQIDGIDTTIYAIHIVDGSTELMVLIETYMDLTELPEILLEALKTVTFPDFAEQTRTGAPANEDGRWFSYCRNVSIALQDDWVYAPQDGADGTYWDCTEKWDYVGSWVVTTPAGDVLVMGSFEVERTLAQSRADFHVPEAVGEENVFEGFNFELLDAGLLPLPSGGEASWIELKLTMSDGVVVYSRRYGRDLDGGTSVEFYVTPEANEPGGDYDWIIPALDSVEMAS